jgi:hypothetical protein
MSWHHTPYIKMLSKQKHEQWVPNISEIDQVYDGTPEKSPLRQFVVVCFPNNVTSDRQAILQCAPEAFVREYAIHASSGANLELPTSDYTSGKYSQSGRIRLDIVLSFRLKDSEEFGLLHLDIICRGSNSSYCNGTLYHVLDTRTISELSFKIFASWLYFESDLGDEEHACQHCTDFECLLDCYEASFVFSQSKIMEIHQDCDERGIENEDLSSIL